MLLPVRCLPLKGAGVCDWHKNHDLAKCGVNAFSKWLNFIGQFLEEQKLQGSWVISHCELLKNRDLWKHFIPRVHKCGMCTNHQKAWHLWTKYSMLKCYMNHNHWNQNFSPLLQFQAEKSVFSHKPILGYQLCV